MQRSTLAILVVALLFLSSLAPAKEESRRVAIILGNGNYLNTSVLINPPNDAREIARVLRALDFQVFSFIDATREDLDRLLCHMSEPGQEIREILTEVRVSVLDETKQRQIPWDHSSLTEEFYSIEPTDPSDFPIPPP